MPDNTDFIDVSHHNNAIDWAQVDVPGVIVRVADGSIGKDRQFDANWAGAGAFNKVRAAYAFWYDSIGAAEQEATLRAALGNARPYILFVDVEGASYREVGLSKAERSDRLADFLTRIADLNPGVYTARYTWEQHIERRAEWKQYPLWVANWGSNLTRPTLPADWTDYVLWQYTALGRVPGITGNVDRNAGRYSIDWYRENWREASAVQLVWPVPESTRVSQHFGKNPNHPTFGYGPAGHMGLDLAVPGNYPIRAMADGVAAYVAFDAGFGNYVRLWHPQLGIHTFYAHLNEHRVQPGQTVRAGQIIGLCGSTGNSTGYHLHLEVRIGSGLHSYVNVPNGHIKGRVDPIAAFYLIRHGGDS